ncbi:MAG: hypothetical protein QW561_03345 [Candidatus Aenigmatarchaeota archaeon]
MKKLIVWLLVMFFSQVSVAGAGGITQKMDEPFQDIGTPAIQGKLSKDQEPEESGKTSRSGGSAGGSVKQRSTTAFAGAEKVYAALKDTLSFLSENGCKVDIVDTGGYAELLCPAGGIIVGNTRGVEPHFLLGAACYTEQKASLVTLSGPEPLTCMDQIFSKGDLVYALQPFAWCIDNTGRSIYSYISIKSPGGNNITVFFGEPMATMMLLQKPDSSFSVVSMPIYQVGFVSYDRGVTRAVRGNDEYMFCGRYPVCSNITRIARGKEYSVYLFKPEACILPKEVVMEYIRMQNAFSRLPSTNFHNIGEVTTIQSAMVEITIDPQLHLTVSKFPVGIETFQSMAESIRKDMELAQSKSLSKGKTAKTSAGVKAGQDAGSVGTDIETVKTIDIKQLLSQKQSKSKTRQSGESAKIEMLPNFILWVSREVFPYNIVRGNYQGLTSEQAQVVAVTLLLADLYYQDVHTLNKLIQTYLALEVL